MSFYSAISNQKGGVAEYVLVIQSLFLHINNVGFLDFSDVWV
jgi:hypothetical protein